MVLMKQFVAYLLMLFLPALSMAGAFESSVPPEEGKMKIYIFRPAFNDQAFAKEAPTLRVNGKIIGKFTQGSYAEIELTPGKHEFSIEPGATESPLWRSAFPVKAVDGRVLYLSFWVAQKLNQRLSRGAAFVAGPLLAYMLDGGHEPTELRMDLMDQVEAEPMLRECQRVTGHAGTQGS